MFKKLALSILIITLTLSLSFSALAKWENLCDIDPELYIQSMQFVNDKMGVATGTGGAFLSSTDGGKTWNKIQMKAVEEFGFYTDMYDIHFADEKNGWVSGDMFKGTAAILNTRDGGKTWERQSSGAGVALYGIYFLDAKNGFAVGGNGTILGTDNGGIRWKPLAGGTASAAIGEGASGFWDIKFVNNKKGWVVGENGAISVTLDGGRTWTAQTSGTDSNLSACDFVNENVGYAVGEGAAIVKTTDGGNTWTVLKSGLAEEWFYDVAFTDEDNGLVVGDYSTILRTTDGGKTWTVERSAKQKGVDNLAYYAVSTMKNGAAFVGGQFGCIFKYTK